MSATTTAVPRHEAWTPRMRSPEAQVALARTTVVVLYGGSSSEREVSLVSGREVLRALAPIAPVTPGLQAVVGVEIEADGRWQVGGQSLDAITALALLPGDAVYFLGLHGGAGEDGRIQALLELAGRCHTGSGVLASGICMDKLLTRLLLADAGLRVASGRVLRRSSAGSCASLPASELPGGPPWFLKPVHGGSSVYARRVESMRELGEAVEAIWRSGDDALLEGYVSGLEVTVGVIGNRRSGIRALPLVEILPRRSPFFDYREKYSSDGAIELCPAQHLDVEQERVVAERALAAYRTAGCDGYARIDFIVPGRADGGYESEPVLLELNTLPGFTPTSLVPLEARALGVTYRELLLEICLLALEGAGTAA